MASPVQIEFFYNDNSEAFRIVDSNTSEIRGTFCNSSFKIRLQFVNAESSGELYSLKNSWDFGDGTILIGEIVEHSYNKPGNYLVTCKQHRTDGAFTEVRFTIVVEECIYSGLFFEEETSKIMHSKTTRIGSLYSFISSYFSGTPRIVPSLINNETDAKNNYWKVRKTTNYHLNPYYTFLKEDTGETDNLQMLYRLTPVENYEPEYFNLYGLCTSIKENVFNFDLYLLFDNENPKINVEFIRKSLKANENITIGEISFITDLSELPQYSSFLGKAAKTPIWFKHDYGTANETITIGFDFHEEDLIVQDEDPENGSYINFASLFKSFETSNNLDNLIDGISTTGLFLKNFTSDGTVLIDEHLSQNLYLNNEIKIYYAKYIENDKGTDGSKSYNLYKGSTDLSDLKFYQSHNGLDSKEPIEVEEVGESEFYKIYSLTPSAPYFYIFKENNIILEKELTDLSSLVIPKEKNIGLDLKRLLAAYMQHPMYEESDNLHTILESVFGANNNLEYVVSKGEHFTDDYCNYRTSYFSSLVDLLTMFGEDVDDYNINALNRSNELKELLRILTMSYSDLFGTMIKKYDIGISVNYKGKNISDQLSVNDYIICGPDNKIKGIYKNEKFYEIKDHLRSEYIVLHDLNTNNTSLLNFIGIESNNIFNNSILPKNFGEYRAYRICEYDRSWGWNLLLPEPIYNYNDKGETIERFYAFYLFNPTPEVQRHYNFIDESTIPQNNGETISKEEWENSFIDDYLMKVLSETLIEP